MPQLVGLHDCAANGTVISQHASLVQVFAVLREKLSRNRREGAMAPKVNVGQTFERLGQETISLVHMRVVVGFPLRNEQARNDLTSKNVTHAGNTRYTKSKINDRHRGGFGSRTTVAEIVRPEVEDHCVWRKFPDQIELG